MKLEFGSLIIAILLYFKSQGTEENDLFCQRTYNFQNLRNETLATANKTCDAILIVAMIFMMDAAKDS